MTKLRISYKGSSVLTSSNISTFTKIFYLGRKDKEFDLRILAQFPSDYVAINWIDTRSGVRILDKTYLLISDQSMQEKVQFFKMLREDTVNSERELVVHLLHKSDAIYKENRNIANIDLLWENSWVSIKFSNDRTISTS